MLKKTLSVLLAVLMAVSVLTVGVVSTSAADYSGVTTDSTKLYFDANSTGFDMTGNRIAFYVFPLDPSVNSRYSGWLGKALVGKDPDGDGIWEYDPTPFKLQDGVQYKIIFAIVDNKVNVLYQTYDLFFDTTCLGVVAYCDGREYENPADSTKTTTAALWDGLDESEYGPVLQVSSIGNVLGTCPEQGKTLYDIFVDFISVVGKTTGVTVLQNARKYTVEAGKKTEQKMIDDIGESLGLTKDDIKAAFDENPMDSGVLDDDGVSYTEGHEPKPITTTWSYDDSTLPAGEIPHEHTPGEAVQENVVPATCTEEGSYDEVIYCSECGEELSRETKTIDKIDHTAGEAVQENVVPATCQAEGSYDEVVYCTECHTELSRTPKTIDKLDHTPGEVVKENEVEADCENAGGYDEVIYCTECKEELSRKHVDIPALNHDIIFVEEVPATASVDGVKAHYECTRCHKLYSDATGSTEVSAEDLVIKAEHKRGDVNGDGEVDIIDATIIQRVLAEFPVEVYDEIAADADLDGIVDMTDVTLIQRIDVGMTTFEKWDAAHAA